MNKFLIAFIASGLAISGTGCAKQCKQARERLIQPTQTVISYLSADPSGEVLANNGCDFVLDQLQYIPAGANKVRKLADHRYTHVNSRCIDYATGYRTVCYYDPYGYRHCFLEPYTYCAQWEYDTIHEPGYAEAIQLSQDMDMMYARAHGMCAKAISGKFEEAREESRALLEYIAGTVKPEGDQVYAMACRR